MPCLFHCRVCSTAVSVPLPCFHKLSHCPHVSFMLMSPAENNTLFFQMTRCGLPRCARCDSEVLDGQWGGGEVRFLSPFGRTSVRS
jgi:hypothetical protein